MDNFCIDCRVAMTKKEVRENQWRCDECQIKHEIEYLNSSVRDHHEWRNRD